MLPARIGKQSPVRDYPRLRVFPWMLHDLIGMLGEHSEAFDLDAYLLRLDSSGEVLPAKIWPWLKDRVSAEAAARGMSAAKTSQTLSYQPTAHEEYDRWPSDCRRDHNGECGNYQAHQIRTMRDAELRAKAGAA